MKKEVERKEGTLIPALLFSLCIVLSFGLLKNSEDLELMQNTLLSITEKYESMREEIDKQNEMIQVVSVSALEEKSNVSESKNIENEEKESVEVSKEELYTLYEVKSGDNLKSISKALYGDEQMASKIKEFNKIDDENLIKIGDLIKIPAQN